MQKLVNNIYWSNSAVFLAGSRINISQKRKVDWSNALMTSGRPLIVWQSSYNYQSNRSVPQLPILKNGTRYRIHAHMTSQPLSSYLIRLTFFDLQGTEIKRVEFRSHERTFVYPEEAVTYQIEIINSGMTALKFDRLEICEDNVSKNAHDDIWVHEPIHVPSSQPLNIILVHEGKQSRKTYPILDDIAPLFPIQVISVSWQYEGNFETWLKDWLQKQKLTKFHLISTDPGFDNLVWKLGQHNDNCKIMLSRPRREGMINYLVWNYSPKIWESPNLVDPNWQKIVNVMNGSWGWRFVYDV